MHAFCQRRLGSVAVLGGLLAFGLAISVVLFSAGDAVADSGTLDVFYTSATAIQVKLGDGTVVSSGSTIPAGSYSVVVYDPNNDTNPELAINGPGVSFSTNLDSTGMGIDQDVTFGPFTFQTSSSYSVEDTNVGPSSAVTFGTSATATAGGGSSTGSSSAPPVTTTPMQTTTMMQTTTAHTSSPKPLGHLVGTVASSGRLTLTLGGKSVRTLKPGLYTVSVVDHSKSDELILGTGTKTKLTLGHTARSRSLTLTAGKWFFEPSLKGPKTAFSVAM